MKFVSSLIGRLSFSRKFLLIGLVFLVPVLVLSYQSVHHSYALLKSTEHELAGLQLNNDLRQLIQQLQLHRGLSNTFLSGDVSSAAKLQALEQQLDTAMAALLAQRQTTLVQFELTGDMHKWQQDWKTLQSSWRGLPAPENFQRHTLLVTELMRLTGVVGDRSELALDPEGDSYHVQNLMYDRLLPVTEQLALARGFGAGIARRQVITQAERIEMAVFAGLIRDKIAEMEGDLNSAYGYSAELKASAGERNARLLSQLSSSQALAVRNFVEPEVPAVDAKQYFSDMTQVVDAAYSLYDHLAERLQQRLEQRRAILLREDVVAAVAVVLSGSLGLLLFFTTYQTLRASVNDLRKVSGQLAAGDLTVRANLAGKDELREIAESFNGMAQQWGVLIRDLSAAVSHVHSSSTQLAQSSSNIAHSSHEQSSSASSMAAAVEEMTVSVAQVADHTRETDQVASGAQRLAAEAQQIVLAAVHEMEQVADAVTQTSSAIDTLNASSAEISQIVAVIKEIADQTNLLALNAAIEAARAGEVGRGFAVVADEVRKLAERTTDATSQIGHTISRIQAETGSAVSSMNQGHQRVGAGVEMIQEAGAAMARIQQGADAVKSAVSDIANAVTEQRNASNDIARNVENIAQMAETNASAVQQAANVANELEHEALRVQQALGHFRL
ncbi:MAG: methyl-accepting chemotaxis protein [Chitinivorax sp.]